MLKINSENMHWMGYATQTYSKGTSDIIAFFGCRQLQCLSRNFAQLAQRRQRRWGSGRESKHKAKKGKSLDYMCITNIDLCSKSPRTERDSRSAFWAKSHHPLGTDLPHAIRGLRRPPGHVQRTYRASLEVHTKPQKQTQARWLAFGILGQPPPSRPSPLERQLPGRKREYPHLCLPLYEGWDCVFAKRELVWACDRAICSAPSSCPPPLEPQPPGPKREYPPPSPTPL